MYRSRCKDRNRHRHSPTFEPPILGFVFLSMELNFESDIVRDHYTVLVIRMIQNRS